MFGVMALIAAITFFVVFNLDYLAHFFGKGYRTIKTTVLADMEGSKDEKWKARRSQYGQFKPQVQRSTLSEWYIAIYAIGRVVTRLWDWLGKGLHKLYLKSPFCGEDSRDQLDPVSPVRVSSLHEHHIPQGNQTIAVPFEAVTSNRHVAIGPQLSDETITALPKRWDSP